MRRNWLCRLGATFGLVALWSQLLLAALPFAAAEATNDPVLGPLVICHAGDAGLPDDPSSPGKAPVPQAAHCPLCLALHQLANFAAPPAGPVVPAPLRLAEAEYKPVPADAPSHCPNGPHRARAPPALI